MCVAPVSAVVVQLSGAAHFAGVAAAAPCAPPPPPGALPVLLGADPLGGSEASVIPGALGVTVSAGVGGGRGPVCGRPRGGRRRCRVSAHPPRAGGWGASSLPTQRRPY